MAKVRADRPLGLRVFKGLEDGINALVKPGYSVHSVALSALYLGIQTLRQSPEMLDAVFLKMRSDRANDKLSDLELPAVAASSEVAPAALASDPLRFGASSVGPSPKRNVGSVALLGEQDGPVADYSKLVSGNS
jgi:hypothetical protein